MSAGSLDALFHPSAVAIVGASGRSDSPYARPLRYLHRFGFSGSVYPVNPRYDEIDGQRCYPGLADLPEPVDLVMVLVSAAQSVQVVRDAANAGAGAAIVCSSGFGETGAAGAALERELLAVANEGGVRLLGPNSQGLFVLGPRLAATFSGALEVGLPLAGRAAYVGQSGAIGGVVLDLARESGLGLAGWVSTGNEVDVTGVEIATHLVADPQVEVVMLYLEALPEGTAYQRLVLDAQAKNTKLVVLRSGSSAAGRRAVASHTGAMVSSDAALELTSREYGVVLVDDVDELVKVAHAALALPAPAGPRVGIVTTSGGAGGIAADSCVRSGLLVEPLPRTDQDLLAELVPSYGAVANPVDVTVQLLTRNDDSFGRVCHAVAECSEIDAVLVLATSPMGSLGELLSRQLVEVTRSVDKPVLTAWMAGTEQTTQGRQIFRSASVPLFASPSDAVAVLARLIRAAPSRDTGDTPRACRPLPELPDACVVLEAQAGGLLDAVGVPRPRSRLAATPSDAVSAVEQVGGIAVLKVQSPRMLHKTEVGGVRVGVRSSEAAAVYTELAQLLADDPQALGVLVQELVPGSAELVVGVTASPAGFAPVLTVGFGGVATEIYADIASAVLPVSRSQARRMLLSLRAAPLLTGFRGRPTLDVDAAADAVVRLTELAMAAGSDLAELEVNPLLVRPQGVCAVDFVLRRHRPGSADG